MRTENTQSEDFFETPRDVTIRETDPLQHFEESKFRARLAAAKDVAPEFHVIFAKRSYCYRLKALVSTF